MITLLSVICDYRGLLRHVITLANKLVYALKAYYLYGLKAQVLTGKEACFYAQFMRISVGVLVVKTSRYKLHYVITLVDCGGCIQRGRLAGSVCL
jgi:hypothetical protein